MSWTIFIHGRGILPELRGETHYYLGRSSLCFDGGSVWRQSSEAARKEYFCYRNSLVMKFGAYLESRRMRVSN